MARTYRNKSRNVSSAGAASESLWAKIPHKAVIFSLVLAAIPFAMGKYFEFNSPGAFDSGAYLYSAKRVLDGAVPGVDEAVTAKAGTLLVNMLGITLFGYADHSGKMMQMLLQTGALATTFFVMRRIFGGLAGGLAVFIASFYLSAPVIAKYGNVKEQYAIAFMMLGVSMMLMRQMGGKWWWSMLAGAFLAWGPMFKETGLSALMATFVFLFAQPLLKNRTWKVTGADIGLVLLGGIIAIGPVHIWITQIGSPPLFNPYVMMTRYAWRTAAGYVRPAPAPAQSDGQSVNQAAPGPQKKKSSDYIEGAREMYGLSKQAPIVLRYYLALILPVSLALGSCLARMVRWLLCALRKIPPESLKPYEKLVPLLGLWWLLDMAFVWVSPRSWEQYYLPLCASGSIAGGYLAGLYSDKHRTTTNKSLWAWVGVAGLICMIVMGWQIFFGLRTSPFSGNKYAKPSRGYVQKFPEIGEASPWEIVAHYIRENSEPSDRIYVWGWYPGIYVESQRMSASAKLPFTSESHVVTPAALEAQAKGLVEDFRREKPKFLVDTRKNDFPWDRPPLEFWPFIPEQSFLPNDPKVIPLFEAQWYDLLKNSFDEDEAGRFNAMKPLRDYVMANYRIISPETYGPIPPPNIAAGRFGIHVLLERRPDAE